MEKVYYYQLWLVGARRWLSHGDVMDCVDELLESRERIYISLPDVIKELDKYFMGWSRLGLLVPEIEVVGFNPFEGEVVRGRLGGCWWG